jgi:hypothetical protein
MEELDFGALLDRFREGGFTRGEQVILANFGTNQTMLSIIFGVPNRLVLRAHNDRDNEIGRRVDLYCGPEQVCIATSTIPKDKNKDAVILDVIGGILGLGQIIVKHNLPNRRNLQDIGRNAHGFWRTYTIEGPNVYMQIHEYFIRKPFVDAGWDAVYREV